VTLPVTLADYEAAAAAKLDAGPLGYYAGGSADELTLRDNEAAWRRIAIRPRVLVDVAERDLRTTVLGQEHPHRAAGSSSTCSRIAACRRRWSSRPSSTATRHW
jgi:4-hydroxymandelate oxidase